MMNYCYLNGQIIPMKKAVISIYDIGFLRGYAVFDYIKVYNGKPFLLEEHLDRLDHSAKEHGLIVPLSHTKISEIVQQLIKKNKAGTCAIRIVLSGGLAQGLEWNKKTPTFAILLEPAPALAKELFTKGGKLITKEFKRVAWDTKHTNYSQAVMLQEDRKKAGAVEILYTWKGTVLEATTSNIFVVKNKTIITPKDDMLFGITRNCVIKLAQQEYKVKEQKITLKQLLEADECFITATNKEVLPIVKVDDTVIGTGTPGQITQKIMALFNQAIQK